MEMVINNIKGHRNKSYNSWYTSNDAHICFDFFLLTWSAFTEAKRQFEQNLAERDRSWLGLPQILSVKGLSQP